MSLLRDALNRLRLLHAGGSRVLVVPASGPNEGAAGRWHVEGERCFVLFDPPASLPEGIAHLRVDLGSGVFRFTGWVRSYDGRHCEVWMHRTIDVQENRGAARVDVALPAMLGPADDRLGERVTVRNLSAKGLAFDTTAEMTLGATYRLRFDGPAGERFGPLTIEIARRVRRDDGWNCGCRLQVTPLLQERLYAFMHEIRRHAEAV